MKPNKIVSFTHADWRSPYHVFALDEDGVLWGYRTQQWERLN
jgi:hypothetical protein